MRTPNRGHGTVVSGPAGSLLRQACVSFLFYPDAGKCKRSILSGPPLAWGLGLGILTRSPGYRGRPGEGRPRTWVLGKFCVGSFCCWGTGLSRILRLSGVKLSLRLTEKDTGGESGQVCGGSGFFLHSRCSQVCKSDGCPWMMVARLWLVMVRNCAGDSNSSQVSRPLQGPSFCRNRTGSH